MERVLELLELFFKQQWVFIVLFILLIIALVGLISKNRKIKKIEDQLSSLEKDFNTIKSMPLTFKLNKAKSLSKVNDFISDDIDNYINTYETVQKSIERMTKLFVQADEALVNNNIKEAQDCILEIEDLVTITLKSVNTLNQKLDDVLEEEVQLRSNVTDLKERFRQIKAGISAKSGLLSFSEDVIEVYVDRAENEFAAFDEWMYISEFNKAQAALDKISENLNKLDEMLIDLPKLLPVAKEVIPSKISNVSSLYSQVRGIDLYLDHLDVTQSLSSISKNLSNDLANLRSGDLEIVKTSLDESSKNLDELSLKLNEELKAQEKLVEIIKTIETMISDTGQKLNLMDENLKDIQKRYNFDDLAVEVEEAEIAHKRVAGKFVKIQNSLNSKTPATSMLAKLEDYQQQLILSIDQVSTLNQRIVEIIADEGRARQQLLKLHLIINEVQVKINEYQLPSISNDYKEDVKLAKEHVRNIELLLDDKKLNLPLLNTSLSESIDYVYKLYNNVNNIVGMAVMIENALVFANRYRSFNPQVDSELSKTELYFRNGEYTQALTTVLAVIESIHPNDYEQLIRENATNVI